MQCKNGLGAVYLQYGDPVAYALHALTEDESRYLQVEKELLATTFTCQKFHDFIYGREAIIETDHKPITAILNKSLHTAPARLQRMLLQLQRYNLKFIYRRGTELHHWTKKRIFTYSKCGANAWQMLRLRTFA